jgi:hypothetical protein
VAKLGDFEPLIRKLANKRTYRFPKTKAIVMTVADQKGADQLAPWIQRVYDRFQNQSTFSNRSLDTKRNLSKDYPKPHEFPYRDVRPRLGS